MDKDEIHVSCLQGARRLSGVQNSAMSTQWLDRREGFKRILELEHKRIHTQILL